MKKTILTAGVFALLITGAFTTLHTDVYKVDPKLSTLEWTGEKVTGKHMGTIAVSSGEIKNDHGNMSGTVVIDMTTIACTDLTGDSKSNLEKHLKSDDFFGCTKFPKATFAITSMKYLGEAKEGGYNYNVKGNLTIKEKTNEIGFDALVKMEGGNKIVCTGTAKVDRSKFDVKYGSKTFFADIGDKMIYDEFSLKFNLVAVK